MRISLLLPITVAVVLVLLTHVAHAAYSYTCNSSVISENSTFIQVQLCQIPNEAVFMNEAVGAYYLNATTVELVAYSIVNGKGVSMNFTLINYYNSSESSRVSISGNGTASVWSNKTIVVFTLNNITFAFIISYIPGVTLPSGFNYSNLLVLIPLAVMLGLSVRTDERRAALGMIVTATALLIIPPYLGYQLNGALLNFINLIYVVAGAAILIMEHQH